MHKFVELITPIGTPLLVFPVSGKSLLCNIIHFPGANLHFHLPPFLRNDSGVERLIAVGLQNGYKVPKTFGDRCVPICDDGVDAPAILFGVRLLQNDADGKKIVYLLKDRKSTRLNSSHVAISYAVFCLKKKKDKNQ